MWAHNCSTVVASFTRTSLKFVAEYKIGIRKLVTRTSYDVFVKGLSINHVINERERWLDLIVKLIGIPYLLIPCLIMITTGEGVENH